MHILIERMKRSAFPHLNEKPYTFADIETIALKEQIDLLIADLPPDILGYLCQRKPPAPRGRQIVLNTSLDEIGRTFVGLHELAHYYLHVPVSPKQHFECPRNADRTQSKHDCEANNFALIAMIPYRLMLELAATPADDLHPAIIELSIKRYRLWLGRGV